MAINTNRKKISRETTEGFHTFVITTVFPARILEWALAESLHFTSAWKYSTAPISKSVVRMAGANRFSKTP
jgi:hypothetical protein